jgi:phospholipid transport system substrate-binding protein
MEIFSVPVRTIMEATRVREMTHARAFRRWPRRLVGAGLCVLLLGGLSLPAAGAGMSAPASTVDRLHATLLEVMRNADSLGFPGRRERLSPVIREAFDLPFIVKVVLGRYWGALPQADRQRMIDTFTRLTIATYAARFDGFSGEAFELVEEKPMKKGRVLVRTRLIRPGDEAAQLDYVLQEEAGRWRILNVVANGVSDLSLKRADYGSIMKKQGFDILVGKLEAQIVKLGKSGD